MGCWAGQEEVFPISDSFLSFLGSSGPGAERREAVGTGAPGMAGFTETALLSLPGEGEVGAPAGQGAGGEAGWRGLEKGFSSGEGAGRRGLDKAASMMGAVTLVVARNQGGTEPRLWGVRLSA